MSQWSSILRHRLYEVVAGFYQHYPIDARGALAAWIEEHVECSQLNTEVHSEEHFYGFKLQMTEELGRVINAIADTEHHWIAYKNVLKSNLTFIQQRYENDPKSLFRTLKQYLEQERRLLDSLTPETSGTADIFMGLQDWVAPSSRLTGLFTQVELVLQQLVIMRDDLCSTRQHIIKLDQINVLSSGATVFGITHQKEIARQENTMLSKNQGFQQAMLELRQLQDNILQQLDSLKTQGLNELNCWIVEQRRNVNGFPIERNLDEIQSLFVRIAHGLVQTYHDVGKAEELQQSAVTYVQTEYPRDVYQHHQLIKSHIMSMIQTIVTKTFIVEVQPFQILRSKAAPAKQKLKTLTHPFIRVRLLVGSALNPTLVVPVPVKASLISEKEARKHHENPQAKFQPKVKLVNDKSHFCCDQNTFQDQDQKKFVAEFRGVTLAEKLEKRSKKKADELVAAAAEKWCFVFQAEFTVLNHKIPIETSSNPVCITCNQSSQDGISWGSLLWDSEFAELNRTPFEVPNEVDCNRLLNVLNQKFLAQTGRGLSEGHRRFLKQKLHGYGMKADERVSWEMFNQERETPSLFECGPDSKRSSRHKKTDTKHVTFWEYIYEILKLCEKSTDPDPEKQDAANQRFQKYWAEGRVEGFISRDEMEKKLKDTRHKGTFMLRFSDTCPGSVTVNLYKPGWEKQKFIPYSLEDLSGRLPLCSRISEKPCLTLLYPDVPKEEAFPQLKSTRNDSKFHRGLKDYIRTYLKEKVDKSSVQLSRNLSESSASPSSSSHLLSVGYPYSAGSLSPASAGRFHESSDNSTSQDQYSFSSSMDEDETTDF